MKIIIDCDNSGPLSKAIIDDVKSQQLPTWGVVYNAQGDPLLTHTPSQWDERVLLVLSETTQSELMVTASYWKDHDIPSLDEIGYYYGRFTEVLLTHYRELIKSIRIVL